jgi:hypothetical protein
MGQKKDSYSTRYGTHHGEVRFGHIHDDNVQSGVMLRTGPDGGRHYMQMDVDGSTEGGRKGGTINRSPGTYQIIAGEDVSKEIPGIYFEATSGDFVINVPKGRLRIAAENVDIRASGTGNEKGVIILDADEKIILKSQQIDLDSKVSTKIFSEKTVECIGKGILNIYGGLIDCADGATKIKGSKGGLFFNEDRFKF